MTRINFDEQVKALKDIVGDEHVHTNIYERLNYADSMVPYDMEEEELPDAIVQPASAQEISEVMKFANRYLIPVTCFGSGTSLIYATKPKEKGIVLSVERLAFLEIREDYGWFECGPGTKNGYIISELGKRGYFLPVQTQSGSSIGGAVSINTLGHLTDNIFSRPVGTVIGLEVVLPTGEIILTGSKSLRRAAGWDLGRIFIGAEGTLGIITKIRMVLIQTPKVVDAVAFFRTVEEIGHAMAMMYKEKLPLPMDGEFVGEKALKVGCEYYHLDFPEGAMAITRSMGRTHEEALTHAKELVAFFRKLGATESYVLEDPEKKEKAWKVRENGQRWGMEKNLKGYVAIEVNPPLPRLAEAMTELTHITEGREDLIGATEAYLYGHVGSDSIHCLFAFPKEWPREKVKHLVEDIWSLEKDLNIKYEGVGGDWGQLPYRVDFYRRKYGEVSYRIIKEMKKVFDPNNILNRGNIEGKLL